jgi:hypothetical protein
MELRPEALRFVLEQGLSATIVVGGRSMEPTIALGTRVDVAPLPIDGPLAAGEIVLIATGVADVLLLHRVMHVSRGGRRIVHQGDVAGAAFATCPRADVLARMTGFTDDATRPLPTPDHLPAATRAQHHRRRVACAVFAGARDVAGALSLDDNALIRRGGLAFRKLARRLAR